MPAPDQNTAEQQMQQQIDAVTAVTDYCQAVVTLLPAYSAAISTQNLQTVVSDATSHAAQWGSGLCRSCTQIVPAMFSGFNDAYQAAQQQILDDEQTLMSDPSDASARSDLQRTLSGLVGALEDRGKQVTALQGTLTDFQTTLQGDHTAIEGVIATLATVSENGVLINEAQAALGVTFLSSQGLSPCMVIVEIDSQVQVNLDGSAAAGTEIIPAVLAQALLTTIASNNETATQALSALADTWEIVSQKYQSTLTDLQNTDAAQIGGILQELDIQESGTAWQQLAQFANSLVPSEKSAPIASE